MASICARGGSKGVPGKNIRLMHGRPLIAHTIERALEAPSIDGVYVSTDSPEIAEVAQREGATVLGLRPPHLATDSAAKVPVIEHLVESVEATGVAIDRVVDLDVTSPLRTVDDIEAALTLLTPEVSVVLSGYLSDKNPYFNMVEADGDGNVHLVAKPADNVVSRQQAPKVYSLNGSIYCWWRATLSQGLWNGVARLYEMPRERSVDIDHELDWKLVEELIAHRTDGPATHAY